MNEKTVHVSLGARSYNILIGFKTLNKLGGRVSEVIKGKKLAVISSPKIWDIYGKEVMASLKSAGFEVHYLPVIDGEEAKSLKWAEKLYEGLISHSFDRKCGVIALGGGVVGDLAGFVASTYMRGIPFVQVPTTLLAQVDSSVGGKVAVNLPSGKNLVGAFYQPSLVFIDLAVLSTLPEKEFVCGIAEVIKYGVIDDPDLFVFLENGYKEILARQTPQIMHIVKRSCQIKASVVEKDEKEGGLRAILNFGHTFAHVIELIEEYKGFNHGEAVAIGMFYAAALSMQKGLCCKETVERIESILKKMKLPRRFDFGDGKEALKLFYRDKKVEDSKLKFVLTESIGSVNITSVVLSEELISLLVQHVK